jgi:hypothetical protein
MSDPTDIAVRAQRFRDAVRAFTPPPPARYAKLMPLKEGIVELREKGASLRLIRELLATVDLSVSIDTIARFLADVNGEQSPQTSKRSVRARRARARTVVLRPASIPAATVATVDKSPPPQASSSNSVATADADKSPERSRARGPRIADPRNL